jgi:hypothetical protein
MIGLPFSAITKAAPFRQPADLFRADDRMSSPGEVRPAMLAGLPGPPGNPGLADRSLLVRGVCGRSAQSAGVQTFLPSRQQLTELLDCRQLAGTDLIVLAVRGFGDPLSDGDEPFVHLGALIRRQCVELGQCGR